MELKDLKVGNFVLVGSNVFIIVRETKLYWITERDNHAGEKYEEYWNKKTGYRRGGSGWVISNIKPLTPEEAEQQKERNRHFNRCRFLNDFDFKILPSELVIQIYELVNKGKRDTKNDGLAQKAK